MRVRVPFGTGPECKLLSQSLSRSTNSMSLGRVYCSRQSQRVFSCCRTMIDALGWKIHSASVTEVQDKTQNAFRPSNIKKVKNMSK